MSDHYHKEKKAHENCVIATKAYRDSNIIRALEMHFSSFCLGDTRKEKSPATVSYSHG